MASAVAPERSRRWLHPLHSVRVRITLTAVLVTAAAVAAVGWLIVVSFEDAQTRELRAGAEAGLDGVAAHLEEGQDPQEALAATGATEAAPSSAPMTVTDEHGRVVGSWPEPVDEDDDDQDDEPAPEDGPDGTASASVVTPTIETISRTAETPTGDLTVTADAPVDEVARNVELLTQRLVIGLPMLVALVGGIAWLLVRRALRPIEAIRAEAERIGGSTMHRRLPEPASRDEVQRLARTMNTMLGRLENSATRQRRFVSDASHELRSPVAAIRAGLELTRGKAEHANWPTRMVDSLLTEESRLEALLDDLLLLAAHDENGTSAAPAKPMNLMALAEEEAQRPRRVPVQLAPPQADTPAVTVAGVPEQLARALSNLVDNAARHARSVVRISVSRDRDTVTLVVDDDGTGIAPQDRERVFERFTRLDDGRARHDGGTGLGLAVVRSIVTYHRGTIRVDDSPLGGARFVTDLPALPP
jgi:signal transduction histidine kinase